MKKLFVFNNNLIILLMENVTVITTVIINSWLFSVVDLDAYII